MANALVIYEAYDEGTTVKVFTSAKEATTFAKELAIVASAKLASLVVYQNVGESRSFLNRW